MHASGIGKACEGGGGFEHPLLAVAGGVGLISDYSATVGTHTGRVLATEQSAADGAVGDDTELLAPRQG